MRSVCGVKPLSRSHQRAIPAEITVGAKTKAELLALLEAASVQLNDYATTLFDDPLFVPSGDVHPVRLVALSLPDLGLPDGGRYSAIVDNAKQVGLEECPLEVGPHLRLAYLDQPVGPYLTVASPLLRPDDDNHPNGFYLRHRDDGLWLRGYEAGVDVVYEPDFTDFVFALP